MICLTAGSLPARTAALALGVLLAGSLQASAQTMCRTALNGTTICSDGTVTRTNLHGTTFDSTGMVWRRTLYGLEISSDRSVRQLRASAAARLRDADGALWNTDPFPVACAGAIGGVSCAAAFAPHYLCE